MGHCSEDCFFVDRGLLVGNNCVGGLLRIPLNQRHAREGRAGDVFEKVLVSGACRPCSGLDV